MDSLAIFTEHGPSQVIRLILQVSIPGIFDCIEQYAPGFKESVVGRDILPPPDQERIFGLTGGNIFHGAMSLDQLYIARPTVEMSNYRTPIQGLYLCGSGAHPGGGVMGAPGRLAAQTVMKDRKILGL